MRFNKTTIGFILAIVASTGITGTAGRIGIEQVEQELEQSQKEVLALKEKNDELSSENDSLGEELSELNDQIESFILESIQPIDEGQLPKFDGQNQIVQLNENKPQLNDNLLPQEPLLKKEGKTIKTVLAKIDSLSFYRTSVTDGFEPLGWKNYSSDYIEGNLFEKTRITPLNINNYKDEEQLTITSTQAFKKEIEKYEDQIEQYVSKTGKEVLLRIDPIYEKDATLCSGVVFQAKSVDSNDLAFHVLVYNEQPNFKINKKTGDIVDIKKEEAEKLEAERKEAEKKAAEEKAAAERSAQEAAAIQQQQQTNQQPVAEPIGSMVWIPNSGSKYHTHAGCSNMKNPRQVTLSEAQALGFTPCKKCY